MREYRVLKALQDTEVPVPRVYAACDDPKYIGAPFYLMEYMRGEVIRADGKNFANTPERRRAVSEGMIDLLIALQKVDWRAAGLEGFGRPTDTFRVSSSDGSISWSARCPIHVRSRS